MNNFINTGFVDLLRHLHPHKEAYTYAVIALKPESATPVGESIIF